MKEWNTDPPPKELNSTNAEKYAPSQTPFYTHFAPSSSITAIWRMGYLGAAVGEARGSGMGASRHGPVLWQGRRGVRSTRRLCGVPPHTAGGVAAGMPETVQGLRAISGRLVSPIPVGESVRDASACFESPA